MEVFCTSQSGAPDYTAQGGPYMRYLGTSLDEAREAVEESFRKNDLRDTSMWPRAFKEGYSALPRTMKWEFVELYSADGYWWSIVKFNLEDSNA